MSYDQSGNLMDYFNESLEAIGRLPQRCQPSEGRARETRGLPEDLLINQRLQWHSPVISRREKTMTIVPPSPSPKLEILPEVLPEVEIVDPTPAELWRQAFQEANERHPLIVSPAEEVPFSEIVRLVCKRYELSKLDLISERRWGRLIYPRQLCMFLGRGLTTMSLPQIGYYLGGRDHTTVLHGIKKIAWRYGLGHDDSLGIAETANEIWDSLNDQENS